jgi:CheY-like chemotaxis protein
MAAVLIVDSYRDEAEMYAQYLRAVGARVEYVRTPEEALARMDCSAPDVIVTDMVFQWSAYDGPAFVRALRTHPHCATTNCIVLSGFTRPVDRRRARAAGADRFLLKPCAPDELRYHIESALYAHALSTRATWNWPDDDTGRAESAPPRLDI